ncbi:hypothetical protein Tco_0569964 [Tanacetum coccineum]
MSSSRSMGSKGKRMTKKSKDNVHKLFHGEEVEKTFITRIVNDEKKEMKKKIGRRSVPKATEVARKAGTAGEDKKGVQTRIKSFMRWRVKVKKIIETIGISWRLVEEEKMK